MFSLEVDRNSVLALVAKVAPFTVWAYFRLPGNGWHYNITLFGFNYIVLD